MDESRFGDVPPGIPWEVSLESQEERFRIPVPAGARAVSVALDPLGGEGPFRALVGATEGGPGLVNLLAEGDAVSDRSLTFLHLEVPEVAEALHIVITSPEGPFGGVGGPAEGFARQRRPSRSFRVRVAFDDPAE